eukprot:279158_1
MSHIVLQINECISIVEKALDKSKVSKTQAKKNRNKKRRNKNTAPSIARYIKIYLIDPERFLIEFSTPKRIGTPRPMYYDISVGNHIFNKVITQHKAYPDDYKSTDNKPYIHRVLITNCKRNRKFSIIVNVYNDESKDNPTKSDIYKIQTCTDPANIQQLQMNNGIISWKEPVYKSFGNIIYELIEANHEENVIFTTKQCSINIDKIYNNQNYKHKQWRIRIKEENYNYDTFSPVIDYNIGNIKTKKFTAAKHILNIDNQSNFKIIEFPQIKKPPKPKILDDINKIQLIDKGTYWLVPSELNHRMNVLTVLNFSDTHTKHKSYNCETLPAADIIIHSGDFTFDGRESEVKKFEQWGQFLASLHIDENKNKNIYKNYYGKNSDKIEEKIELLDIENRKYKHLICIAGNHETTFDVKWYNKDGSNGQRKHKYFKPKPNAEEIKDIILKSKYWIYLQDSGIQLYGLNIYGTPWQPAYNDWGFNLNRNSNELKDKWKLIPKDTDILITHSPPLGHGDKVGAREEYEYCGCKHLNERIKEINNISYHIFGHVHSGFGCTKQKDINKTTYINASSVDHRYAPKHKPIMFYIQKKEY